MTVWRKQILVFASIMWPNSRRLQLDRQFIDALVKSFDAGELQIVPLTSPDWTCTGTVVALEVTEDGLDALIDVGPLTDGVLEACPDLPVACRLMESYPDRDGRGVPVLLGVHFTHAPSPLRGMRPWRREQSR